MRYRTSSGSAGLPGSAVQQSQQKMPPAIAKRIFRYFKGTPRDGVCLPAFCPLVNATGWVENGTDGTDTTDGGMGRKSAAPVPYSHSVSSVPFVPFRPILRDRLDLDLPKRVLLRDPELFQTNQL